MATRRLALFVGVVGASNSSYTPKCSVNGVAGGQVVTLSDGKNQRCMSLITPASAQKPMPVLFWFHGSGGNAGNCGSSKLVALSEQHGFAFILEKLLMDNGTYHMSSLTKLAHRAIHQILWSLAT